MKNYTVEIFEGGTRFLGVTTEELNLDKTLNCGQAFRWEKINNTEWCGVIYNKVVILGQSKDKNGVEYLYTNLNLDDAYLVYDYLNLDMVYTAEIEKLELNEFERKVYEYSKGIHILRQDLFETMVTFLMSSCNTMHNIRNIINKLCTFYGEKITVEYRGETIIRYAFPTLEKLRTLKEQDFILCGMGFRAKYLAKMVYELNEFYLEQLTMMEYKLAMKSLQTFKGVGVKVANCIALFGLHHIDAFPIDTHMSQIINTYYNGYIDISRFKGLSGIMQQYMFYYKAFN